MWHDRIGTVVLVALLGASSIRCAASELEAVAVVETPDAASPSMDAGSSETPATDGGNEAGLLATVPSGTAVDFIALSGDYVVYASATSGTLGFVKKDGSDPHVVEGVCGDTGCRGLVSQGTTVSAWNTIGTVKQLAPPSIAVTTLPNATKPLTAEARTDGRYLWFRETAGGFERYDTLGTSAVERASERAGGFEVSGGRLYYTVADGSEQVLRAIDAPLVGETTDITSRSTVTPDDVGGGVAVDATSAVFLTTQKTNPTSVHVWNVTPEGETTRLATLEATIEKGRPLLDAENVYVVGRSGAEGSIVSVSRAARNAAGGRVVATYPQSITALAKDDDAFYIGTGAKLSRRALR